VENDVHILQKRNRWMLVQRILSQVECCIPNLQQLIGNINESKLCGPCIEKRRKKYLLLSQFSKSDLFQGEIKQISKLLEEFVRIQSFCTKSSHFSKFRDNKRFCIILDVSSVNFFQWDKVRMLKVFLNVFF